VKAIASSHPYHVNVRLLSKHIPFGNTCVASRRNIVSAGCRDAFIFSLSHQTPETSIPIGVTRVGHPPPLPFPLHSSHLLLPSTKPPRRGVRFEGCMKLKTTESSRHLPRHQPGTSLCSRGGAHPESSLTPPLPPFSSSSLGLSPHPGPSKVYSSRGPHGGTATYEDVNIKKFSRITRRARGKNAMWLQRGFSSRSASEHRRPTDVFFLGQSEGRRGVDGMPLCLARLQHQRHFTEEDIDRRH